MGNSNILGYVAGAYNHLEDKKRKDAELAMDQTFKQMQMNAMRQRSIDDQNRRQRESEEWKWRKEDKEKEREEKRKKEESLYLAPLIRPFVPNLNRDIAGKSTLEAPLPNKFMGDVLSAAGGMSLAPMPGVPTPGDLLPDQVKHEDFITGDEQAALFKEQLKRAGDDEKIAFEVRKRKALQNVGVGYNDRPRRGAATAGADEDISSSTSSISSPISVPAFTPYKKVTDLYASGSPEEKAALAGIYQAHKDEGILSDSEAKQDALRQINDMRLMQLKKQQEAEAEAKRRADLDKKTPKDLSMADVENDVMSGIGLSTGTVNLQPKNGSIINGPQSPVPEAGASASLDLPQQSSLVSASIPIIRPYSGGVVGKMGPVPSPGSFEDQHREILRRQQPQAPISPAASSHAGLFDQSIGDLEAQKSSLQQKLAMLDAFLSPQSDPSNSFRQAEASLPPAEKQNALIQREALISAIAKLEETIAPMRANGQNVLPGRLPQLYGTLNDVGTAINNRQSQLLSQLGQFLLPNKAPTNAVSPADAAYQNYLRQIGR